MSNNHIESTNQNISPIVICGMHRSGTSLIAQILESCGLNLGNEDQLLGPTPIDNQSGYWELRDLVIFSRDLLRSIGGDFDNITPLKTQNWTSFLDLEKEQSEAKEILSPFIQSGEIWGWKDPRATVMLPFWQQLFPKLRLVICVRNPLEVAYSLSKRTITHVDFDDGLNLWRDYYEILERDIDNTETIHVHYESILHNPDPEILRLCDFIGLRPSESKIENAINRINLDLRRNFLPEALLAQLENLPSGLIDIYGDLCKKSNKKLLINDSEEFFDNQYYLQILKKFLVSSSNTFDLFFNLLDDRRRMIQELYTANDSLLDVNNLLHENLEIKDKLNQLNQEIIFYATSKSWQVTRPLRKIAKLNDFKLGD